MFEKQGKYFADWRDQTGRRQRKSFTSQRAALRFEEEQKELAHPKTTGTGETLAPLLRAFSAGVSRHDCATRYAAQALVDIAGSTNPRRLSAAHVIEAAAACAPATCHPSQETTGSHRSAESCAHCGKTTARRNSTAACPAPRPHALAPSQPRAKKSTALKTHAPADLRLFIALCADLAIRSGTAVRLACRIRPAARHPPLHNKERRARRLPVTAEVAGLFALCDMRNPQPFITQTRNAPTQNARQG